MNSIISVWYTCHFILFIVLRIRLFQCDTLATLFSIFWYEFDYFSAIHLPLYSLYCVMNSIISVWYTCHFILYILIWIRLFQCDTLPTLFSILCYEFDYFSVIHLPAGGPQAPHGVWRKQVVWKARWIKEWRQEKVWKPLWKKVWGPVEIQEWIPIPKPPPGWEPKKPEWLWQTRTQNVTVTVYLIYLTQPMDSCIPPSHFI